MAPSRSRVIPMALLFLTLAAIATSSAQEADAPGAETAPAGAEPDAKADGQTPSLGVMELIAASGGIGMTIIGLSIAALALMLEHVLTIRRSVLAPPGVAETLHRHITAGEYKPADGACKQQPSYLTFVVSAGLQEVRLGYGAVEKAMEDSSQEQAARLFRKAEYLALIGSIAPMLGLLGTVYGLLLAFKKVSETQGAALASDLADGIYLALITTVMGLVVAIPALSAYAIFRSRIEQFAAEVNLLAEQVFVNYKQSRGPRRADEASDAYR